uniref:F-box domain-containing protein n=1 Tax=Moniliophthora roreri TaxID=221103 RepID=A0A0W0FKM6_MONRR
MQTVILCEQCNHSFTPEPTQLPFPFWCQSAPEASKAEAAQLIALEEIELQRYDIELERLRNTVRNLELGRTALFRQIQQHRNSSISIGRVPTEILEIIFADLADVEYFLSIADNDGCQAIAAPLFVATQVCTLWRNIVTSHPEWWTSIDVDIFSLKRDINPLLDIFFHNSKSHPLTIRIVDSGRPEDMDDFDESDTYYKHPTPYGLSAFINLLQQAPRIEHLEINTYEYVFSCLKTHKLIPDSPITFNILRSFTYHGALEPDFEDDEWFCNGLLEAPLLSDVTIINSPPPNLFQLDRLTSLTILQVDGDGLPEMLSALVTCTTLHSLIFDKDDIEPFVLPIATILPSVRFLSVGESGSSHAMIFDYLTLPSLETLETTVAENWPHESLRDMIRRSVSSLKTLTVIDDSSIRKLDSSSLLELFGLCPELTVLKLDRLRGELAVGYILPVLEGQCPSLTEIRVAKSQMDEAEKIVRSTVRIVGV